MNRATFEELKGKKALQAVFNETNICVSPDPVSEGEEPKPLTDILGSIMKAGLFSFVEVQGELQLPTDRPEVGLSVGLRYV